MYTRNLFYYSQITILTLAGDHYYIALAHGTSQWITIDRQWSILFYFNSALVLIKRKIIMTYFTKSNYGFISDDGRFPGVSTSLSLPPISLTFLLLVAQWINTLNHPWWAYLFPPYLLQFARQDRIESFYNIFTNI